MTQSQEPDMQRADSTNASTDTEKGFPPWALINWEPDRKCITYSCFPPPVQRNIESGFLYGVMILLCFGPLWHSEVCCDLTPGSLFYAKHIMQSSRGFHKLLF